MAIKDLNGRELITQNALKELLHYDPKTGFFFWRKSGKKAGCLDKSNLYVKIRVNYHIYYAHRLVFLYMNGNFPSHQVDHINGNRSDNRYKNLRYANNCINQKNMKLAKTNKTGLSGVCTFSPKYCNGLIYFKSRIYHENRVVNLYDGPDFFEACARRKSAENKYGYHVNHGRKS